MIINAILVANNAVIFWTGSYCYWIGLSRLSESSDMRWLDGKLLEGEFLDTDYVKRINFDPSFYTSNNRCACIEKKKNAGYWVRTIGCDFKTYPLCHIRGRLSLYTQFILSRLWQSQA